MKRYTKKIKNANNYCEYELKYNPYTEMFDLTSNIHIEDYVDADLTLAIDKLGKIEDLEEELGCPLEVVFKALMNGIYIKNIDGEMVNFKCRLTYKNEELGWYFNIINGYVMVKDYKKTWWLKKDKSE